jgi:alkylation response protein AidB-like acyl-CoA dehydrogenase
MRQAGIEIRPIVQLTGSSEFNEVFFEGARTPADHVVGRVGDGWRVAMATLAFERGVSTLGQQHHFETELTRITEAAKQNGKSRDPMIRQRLANAWMELSIMRHNTLRALSGASTSTELPREALILKLFWANWHRDLGNLGMDVLGPAGQVLQGAPYELTPLQRLFLFTRADTIYAGSN